LRRPKPRPHVCARFSAATGGLFAEMLAVRRDRLLDQIGALALAALNAALGDVRHRARHEAA